MKILQIVHDFLPNHTAGAELYTYHLSKALSKHHEVYLYFTDYDPNRTIYSVEEGTFDGLSFFSVNVSHMHNSFKETYENEQMDRIFVNILDRLQPDVIHIQHLLNHSINYITIAKQRNLPVIFTLHEYWLTCPRYGQRMKVDGTICHLINVKDCATCMLGPSSRSARLNRIIKSFTKPRLDPINLIDRLNSANIKTPGQNFVGISEFSLKGTTRRVLLAHPPANISYRLHVPPGARLSFFIAMQPATFSQSGSGVRFLVTANNKVVYSKTIDPKNIRKDQIWHEANISLHGYAGENILLQFVTEPGANNNTDYCTCGWGELQIIQDDSLVSRRTPLTDTLQKVFYRIVKYLEKKHMEIKINSRITRIKYICKDVDLFIAPSHFLRHKFIEFGLPMEKIVFCEYGYDVSRFTQLHHRSSSKIRFGYIGTISFHKGIHVLIEAFNSISTDEAELHVHGDLTWFPEYVDHLLSIKTHDNILLLDRFDNDDVAKVLSSIDVLVTPSIWYENSPLTVHEAFMAGIPVIASNLGGLAESVTDGKDGLLFDVGNAKSLTAKLNEIIEQKGLLEKLRNGIEPVKSISDNAKEIGDFYGKFAP